MATTETLLRTIDLTSFSGDPDYEVMQTIPEWLTPVRSTPGRCGFVLRFRNGNTESAEPVAGTADVQIIGVHGTPEGGLSTRPFGAPSQPGLSTGRMMLAEHGYNMALGLRVTNVNTGDPSYIVQVWWCDYD